MEGGRTSTDQTEVEWQFDAPDLGAAEAWLSLLGGRKVGAAPVLTVQPGARLSLVDHYMDTEDRRLGRAGLVLRIRQRGSDAEVTMKDVRPASSSGLRRRLELTEPLPEGGVAALGDQGPVGSRIAAVAGTRAVAPVLEVRTRRTPFSLVAGGDEVAEVALDETVLVAGDGQRPARLRRVEVEVSPGWVDRLEPVVEDLRAAAGLRPASLSKFESGMLAAGVRLPGPVELGPTDFSPTATVGEVVYAIVRRNIHAMLVHEPGTRLGEDPEELHDMRVATRRLRAALALFADALPPRASLLRHELGWAARALGAVRDLDVQLQNLGDLDAWSAGWPEGPMAVATVRTLLQRSRDRARQDLLGVLDSPRWEALTEALVALAQRGPRRQLAPGSLPAVVALPALVRRRRRQAVRAARIARRTGEAADFHRLRIRCKWLRYAAECTVELYGSDTVRFVKELARLQDHLGRAQDAEVAAARFAALVGGDGRGTGPTLPATVTFMIGAMAEHVRQTAGDLRSDTATSLVALMGRPWERLEAAMAARTAPSSVAPPDERPS